MENETEDDGDKTSNKKRKSFENIKLSIKNKSKYCTNLLKSGLDLRK